MTTTIKEKDASAVMKEKVLSIAMGEAIKYSTIYTAVAVVGTLAAAYKYKGFKNNTSMSIKLSIPTMTFLGTFSYYFETTMTSAMLKPEKWGLAEAGKQKKVSVMPFHHKAINYLYDHPFQFVAGLGVPLAGSIFYTQMQHKHLTLSQKVMHSRVYAQGGVLSILLTTMVFREWMDRRGRFPGDEPEDEESN